MSPIVRWWLYGRWTAATRAAAIACVDACVVALGCAAVLLLI